MFDEYACTKKDYTVFYIMYVSETVTNYYKTGHLEIKRSCVHGNKKKPMTRDKMPYVVEINYEYHAVNVIRKHVTF